MKHKYRSILIVILILLLLFLAGCNHNKYISSIEIKDNTLMEGEETELFFTIGNPYITGRNFLVRFTTDDDLDIGAEYVTVFVKGLSEKTFNKIIKANEIESGKRVVSIKVVAYAFVKGDGDDDSGFMDDDYSGFIEITNVKKNCYYEEMVWVTSNCHCSEEHRIYGWYFDEDFQEIKKYGWISQENNYTQLACKPKSDGKIIGCWFRYTNISNTDLKDSGMELRKRCE